MKNNVENNHIGTDTIKLTGSKIVTMMIALISSMLLSRFRSLEEYGTYSQLLMAVNLACSLIMLGLPNSLNFFLAKTKTEKERDKFLSVYYTLNTILSLIVGIVLICSMPLLEKIFKNDLIRSFWYFLALFPWTKIIMSGVENLLIVLQKTTLLMIYRIMNSVMLLGIIIIVQLLHETFATYMLLYLLVEVFFTIVVYLIAKMNTNHFGPSLDKTIIKSVFMFSIPIGIASMIGTLNIELDKLVITTFFSTEKLAVYTNASRELPVTIIATSLTAVLLPQMVRLLHANKKEEAVKLWGNATTISFAIISFTAAACIAFAPEVIMVLYSEKYLEGVMIFRIYCLVLLLKCTYFGMVLNAIGKTNFVLYSSIGALFFNLLFNYLCFYLFGFIGPAIATLISTFSMSMFQLFYSSQNINISFKKIFPWKKCSFYLFFNIILGIIFFALKNLICQIFKWNSVLIAIILGVIWLFIYTLVIRKSLKKEWIKLNE